MTTADIKPPHPTQGKGFSEALKAHAVERVRQGETKQAVARELGINPITLAVWCKRAGGVAPIIARPTAPMVRQEVGRLIAIDPALRGEVHGCLLALRRTLQIILEGIENTLAQGPREKESGANWLEAQTAALAKIVEAHQVFGAGQPAAIGTTTTTVERLVHYQAEARQVFMEMAREGAVVEGEAREVVDKAPNA